MWSGADGAADRERANCDGDHIADDRGLVAFSGIGTRTGGPSHEHTTCRQRPGASGVGVIRARIDDPFQLAAGSEGGCDDNQHGDNNRHGDTPQRRRAWVIHMMPADTYQGGKLLSERLLLRGQG